MDKIETVPAAYEKIPGGVYVCTPDDINLLTVYVLREQGDWFEDEIKFLRNALQPGANVVDIGASYGCYSLTAAAFCARGHVWAYEPCSMTAHYLRQGIERNGFKNMTLIQAAMSDHSGKGKLRLQKNSEMNSIGEVAGGEGSEDIDLTTIDSERRKWSWPAIDFMKIDAEGHELSVIRGGTEFFTANSPLVMLEIRKESDFDFSAVLLLAKLGYETYQYMPALDALVPTKRGEQVDCFLLNVFCCKPDRAAELSDRGLLILRSEVDNASFSPPEDVWNTYISRFAYIEMLQQFQAIASAEPEGELYRRALDYYAFAMRPEAALSQRWTALRECLGLLSNICERAPTTARLFSLARVSAELGAREKAVGVLTQILRGFAQTQQFVLNEPFLCPSREFDQIPPGNNPIGWMQCAVLDAFEKMRAVSSYILPEATPIIANNMRQLGFCTPEIERRDALISKRASLFK